MQQKPSVKIHPLISDEQAVNVVRKALGQFAGRGKRHRLEQVATGAGIDLSTLAKFRTYAPGHPDYRPLDWGQLFSLMAYLRCDFTSEVLRVCEQGAYDFDDDEPSPGDLASEVAEDAAAVVRATAGGGSANLAQIGARMVRHGQAITTMGARAA